MSVLATYGLGLCAALILAVGWLVVQRLWLRWTDLGGGAVDALEGRFTCTGRGGCGACDGSCERHGEESSGGESEP